MLKTTFLGAEGGPREKQLKNKSTCIGQWIMVLTQKLHQKTHVGLFY